MSDKCWFCNSDKPNMVYEEKWDTYVHIECIAKALELNPNDVEADMMSYLIRGMNYGSNKKEYK